EDYIADQTCLVPGPFIADVVFRNLMIGGVTGGEPDIGSLFLKNTANVTLENVRLVVGDSSLYADGVQFVGSQYVRLVGCAARLEHSTTHNLSAVDCLIPVYATCSVETISFPRQPGA